MIPALVGKDDLILADRLCHACMWDGARLSGATVMRFDHNDVDHCRELLEAHRGRFGRCLILTETVFSMDGDRGPIGELGELARRHDAWLMTDDAHGLGVCPAQPADVQMGTLSKAAGSCGGYVCGSSELIAWLENRARSLHVLDRPAAGVGRRRRGGAADHPGRSGAAGQAAGERPAIHRRTRTTARRKPDRAGRSSASPNGRWRPRPCWRSTDCSSSRSGRRPSRPGTARLRFAFSAMHEPEPIERAAALLKEHRYA